MTHPVAVALILASAIISSGCASDDRVVVAAGTTIVDSGLIERVLEQYPADAEVSVVGASSLEALALGGSGSADILITHLPEAEAAFLLQQPGATQEAVFTSQFVIVGPDDGPLIQNASPPGAVESFVLIVAAGHPFVSRADGSGTAARERRLWELAGIDPTGLSWYVETGQGMGFTLQVADQRDAYTLAEIGTFVGAEAITLIPFVGAEDDERLLNPYRITLVEGASKPAQRLFEWITSEAGVKAITVANLELFDALLYIPAPLS